MFRCVISHVFLYTDFYVQTVNPVIDELLTNLQYIIQEKIGTNILQPMTHPELNRLCVAYFNDDQQYYRAKITGFTNSEVEVLFIDYGK